MVVSIFTDISINKKISAGGYAFYIGCRAGKLQRAGKLKGDATESNTAEAQCIVNALYLLNRTVINGVSRVIIYTDNSNVIDAFESKPSFHGKEKAHRGGCSFYYAISEIKIAMIEYCVARGWRVEDYKKAFSIKLVKAHTGNSDKLSVINDWCDTESRKYAAEK